jgi:hypothetical protein
MSAAPTPSVTTSSSAFVDFLLAQFRCAGIRARIIVNEIEAMQAALTAGLIAPEVAVLHVHEVGALGLLPTSSATKGATRC